jgi:succinate dehydrogenase / fumarate reductase membrane anchor subunit
MAGGAMSLQTPLRRVVHYRAAHDGTAQFWRQRLTGAAAAILVVFFIGILMATVGQPHDHVVSVLRMPLVAVALALLIVTSAVHMRIGLQVVIEDYIHGSGLKVVCLIANTFFCVAIAAVGLAAIVILVLGGPPPHG